MGTKYYRSGTLVWIDDVFEGKKLSENGDTWGKLFGECPDSVFRLMDLNVEIETSYLGAMEILESHDKAMSSGEYVTWILDLGIPKAGVMEEGEDGGIGNSGKISSKYGIVVAQRLKNNDTDFAILSQNTKADNELARRKLEAIPYYTKESGSDCWRIPRPLAMSILSSFARNISWLLMDEIIEAMHPDSSFMAIYHENLKKSGSGFSPLKYFPFFGSFKNFVERYEFWDHYMPKGAFAVRADKYHCDYFVQQCMLIMLFDELLKAPGQIRFNYVRSDTENFAFSLYNTVQERSGKSIDVIRLITEKGKKKGRISIEDFKTLLDESMRKPNSTAIYVIPDDETADEYSDILMAHDIPTIDDLPHTKNCDAEEKEVMIRKCAALALQSWGAGIDDPLFEIPDVYICHPEVIVNPINWVAMIETKMEKVFESLSDPYEIVDEFYKSLDALGKDPEKIGCVKEAFRKKMPIPYEYLLRVGQETLETEGKDDKIFIIEKAIDTWLNESWRFPYGAVIHSEVGAEARKEEAYFDKEHDAWEDICFRTLIGMLAAYEKVLTEQKKKEANRQPDVEKSGKKEKLSSLQRDLGRVKRFVVALGGEQFLDLKNNNSEGVDWNKLDPLRWPHLRYPMPGAINRRLKTARKHLWIQHEGLDLASTLPYGNDRYRLLLCTVEQYASVLSWCRKISPFLPKGWSKSVSYLTEVIADHRMEEAWQKESGEVRKALLCLVKNGGPIMFIAQQILLGQPLAGSRDRALGHLSEVQGYGKVIGPVRGRRDSLLGKCIIPDRASSDLFPSADKIKSALDFFLTTKNDTQASIFNKYEAIHSAITDLLGSFSEVVNKPGNPVKGITDQDVADIMSGFFSQSGLDMTSVENWFREKGKFKDGSVYKKMPSLLGMKEDHLWEAIDALMILDSLTKRFRYFDGYHLLATINDLRCEFKDSGDFNSFISMSEIEVVLDLYVAGIEGLIAQLSFCAEIAGEKELAEKIRPNGVLIKTPEGFQPPDPGELSKVMRINQNEDNWEVFTLGLPGSGASRKLCYDDFGRIGMCACMPVSG